MKENCETCRFWDGSSPDATGWGMCRRNPPTHVSHEILDGGGIANVGFWPDTEDDDWCGEFQEKIELRPKATKKTKDMSAEELEAWHELSKAAECLRVAQIKAGRK